MKTRNILERVKNLESQLAVEGPVYVLKVEGWGFGIQFPGDPVKREWEWDIDRLIGCDYHISSMGPGRRFDTREEAEAWIREDKKNYPKDRFTGQPESCSRAWLRDRDGKLIPKERIAPWLINPELATKEAIARPES